MKDQRPKTKDQSQRPKLKNELMSIIIPCKAINDYLINKTIPALTRQTYKNFELIIVIEKNKVKRENVKLPDFVTIIISNLKSPPRKRDLGAKRAKGEFLVFIDDDVYPKKNWLENINSEFINKEVNAVVGPGITPMDDNLYEKVSGYIWQSWLGAGGAGTFRSRVENERYVDDYPTFNFAIRKQDFELAGGFACDYWPGEDTKICHELVCKHKKKILYSPKCVVYHHRRPIFSEHLKQVGRYGMQRGRFVVLMPKNNLRMGYFIPSLFSLYIVTILILGKFSYIFNIPAYIYVLLVLIESISVFSKSKSIKIALLYAPSILLTHLFYGIRFMLGLVAGIKERLDYTLVPK